MKLIQATLIEHLTYSQSRAETLLEDDAETGKKNLFLKGVFIEGGVKNHNERIYPVSEIRKAVQEANKKIKENNGLPGESDHPPELTINISRISHLITEMWMDGNSGMGKLRILPTPEGNIARTLIEAGLRIGVSSRGVGNVDERGYVSEYAIVTCDLVISPSAPNAYPKPVYEAFRFKNGRTLRELAEAVSHDPKAQKYLSKELFAVIDKLF